jgi:SAM-dependent methyltransferase
VDVAESMLALAAERHPELELRRGSAEELPFEDDSFDAVVANFVLLHLGRPERAAVEFARVLAAGGRLALTVWDVPERARLLGVVLDAVAEVDATPPPDLPLGPPLFRFADDEELERLLLGSSLDDFQTQTIGFDHHVASADDLWEGLLAGTVRVSPLVLGQEESTRQRIREAFDRLVEGHRAGDGYELPVSVKLASARKPDA